MPETIDEQICHFIGGPFGVLRGDGWQADGIEEVDAPAVMGGDEVGNAMDGAREAARPDERTCGLSPQCIPLSP